MKDKEMSEHTTITEQFQPMPLVEQVSFSSSEPQRMRAITATLWDVNTLKNLTDDIHKQFPVYICPVPFINFEERNFTIKTLSFLEIIIRTSGRFDLSSDVQRDSYFISPNEKYFFSQPLEQFPSLVSLVGSSDHMSKHITTSQLWLISKGAQFRSKSTSDALIFNVHGSQQLILKPHNDHRLGSNFNYRTVLSAGELAAAPNNCQYCQLVFVLCCVCRVPNEKSHVPLRVLLCGSDRIQHCPEPITPVK
jgi:hypothetical protein